MAAEVMTAWAGVLSNLIVKLAGFCDKRRGSECSLHLKLEFR